MSNIDYSLSSLNLAGPIDLTQGLSGADEMTKIRKVSKAMEAIFVNQLTAELGKGIDGSDDETTKPYGDFIQQAMTQGISQGGGFSLAGMIESTLTKNKGGAKPMPVTFHSQNTYYHVNHAE